MTAYLISIATFVGFFMILALALNLQWGMTGMVNFGVAGFYGIGAYASGLLTVKAGVPVGLAIVVAGGAGWLFGAAVAALTVRLKDDFLAIVTLGFGESMRLVFLNEDWLTNGPRGLPIDVRPMASWFGREAYSLVYLGLVIAAVAACFAIAEVLRRAPYGRVLRAIREDDLVAAVLGKPVLRYRVHVFAIGTAMMGVAGALYAHYTQNISPDHFTAFVAIFIWMSVIVGGAGNNTGLLIGAGAVITVLEGSRFLGDAVPFLESAQVSALRIIVIGTAIILMIRFRPQGLMPEPRFAGSRFAGGAQPPRHGRDRDVDPNEQGESP